MSDPGEEFPILRDCVYFNHAAVSPMPARAAAALSDWIHQAQHSVHRDWPRWSAALGRARHHAAALLGCPPETLTTVHNTTHGLQCIANSLPWRPGDNAVIAAHEFPANVYPWSNLSGRGVALRTVEERPDARFAADDFAAVIDGRTRVVAISMVQYSTGFRMPVEELAGLCRERGALLCIDGIQAAGAMPIDVEALGCDVFVTGGQKWLIGPEGLGYMYVRPGLIERFDDSMTSWLGRARPGDYDDAEQPPRPDARRFEEGSRPMGLAVASERSLSLLLETGAAEIWSRIEALTARLTEGLATRGFEIVSPRADGERSGIVAFRREGTDAGAWVRELGERGIHLAARRGWFRASPHFYNTAGQIDRLLEALDSIEADRRATPSCEA